jgi:hypothetical protein
MLIAMGEHPGRLVTLAAAAAANFAFRGVRRTVDYRDTRQLRLREG